MKDIVIYGAGGFGREVACLIKQINEISLSWNLLGFLDDGKCIGDKNEYGPILGGIAELNAWKTPISVVIAMGNPEIIKTIVSKIKNEIVEFPNIIAPNVCLLDENSLVMGKGNVICSNSIISCNVKLGDFNILNVYVQVGHDTQLGNYNVAMPSVNISGGILIDECNLFGVKSTVLQYLKIGVGITLAAGSVLMKNTTDNTTYLGNPARPFFAK